MLTNLINYAIQNNPKFSGNRQMEFEIRFGKYGRISSNIKKETFMRIVNNKNKKTFQLIDEVIYESAEKSPIRQRIIYDDNKSVKDLFDNPDSISASSIQEILEKYRKTGSGKIMYISKELIGKKITTSAYNASISAEITHDSAAKGEISATRCKLRCSWTENMWIHDMTILLINKDNKVGVFYEVEIEFDNAVLKNKPDADEILRNTVKNINIITTFIDCAKTSPVEVEMYHSILNSVATMERKDLEILKYARYAVCDKADGERKFVFIDSKNDVFHFNPTEGIITKTPLSIKANIPDTLIDCELTNDIFYGFDILFFKGSDCRSNDLIKRLSLLNQVITIFNSDKFKIKKLYLKDVFKNAALIWNDRKKLFPYNLDGLIFTPVRGAYIGNFMNLKYKPLLSIDVRILYTQNTDFTEFYSAGHPIEINGRIVNAYNVKNKTYYKSRVTIQDDTLKRMNVINRNGVLGMKGKIAGQPDMINIVEMEFVPDEGWKILRTRPDKENPNTYKSIISVLNAIKDNITIDEISKIKYVQSPLEKVLEKSKSPDSTGFNFTTPTIKSDICHFYSYVYDNILKSVKGKSILVLGADICILDGLLVSDYIDIDIIESSELEVYSQEKSEGYIGLKEYYDKVSQKSPQKEEKGINITFGDMSKIKTKKKYDTVFIKSFELINDKLIDQLKKISKNIIGLYYNRDAIVKILENQDCILLRNKELHPLYKLYLYPQKSSKSHQIEIQRMQHSYKSEFQPMISEKDIAALLKNVKTTGLITSFLPGYKKEEEHKNISEYDFIIANITSYFAASF